MKKLARAQQAEPLASKSAIEGRSDSSILMNFFEIAAVAGGFGSTHAFGISIV
jgi:hypothetical protein